MKIRESVAADLADPSSRSQSRPDTSRSLSILVVDDDRDSADGIAMLLERWKHRVRVAYDARGAMEIFREQHPDLVLLDIGLPNMNGIAAARQIRYLAPESKIVFLSLESSLDVVQEALSFGASAYVLKARAASDLLAAVEAVLQEGHSLVSSTAE